MDLMSNQSISEDTKDDWIVSTYCFNASAINTSDTVKAETVFWLEGVCLTSTSIVGIIGNSITIAVLNRISLDNVFNQVSQMTSDDIIFDYICLYVSYCILQLIVMLCVIDSMFAGFSLIEYGLKKGFKLLNYSTPIYVNIWPTLVYPFHNITYSLSIFITLAIAIERYVFSKIEIGHFLTHFLDFLGTWPFAIHS